MSLHLLQLPTLVLNDVIKQMDPSGLFALSLCSRKTNRLAKYFRDKAKKWSLGVRDSKVSLFFDHPPSGEDEDYIREKYKIEITKNAPEKLEAVKILGQDTVVFPKCKNKFFAYFKDEQSGLKVVIDHIYDLFAIDVCNLSISKKGIWIIDWFNNRRKYEWGVMEEEKENLSEKEYLHVLRNLKPTEALTFLTTTTPANIHYSHVLHKVDYFKMNEVPWLTQEHLLTMDVVDMWVGKSKLTNMDISVFLFYWMLGGSPRLKWITVELDEPVDDRIFSWITENRVMVVNERRTYNGRFRGFSLHVCCDVTRLDGVRASISVSGRFFQFVVWPDEQF